MWKSDRLWHTAQMKFIPKPGCFVIKFPDDATRNMFFWSQEATGAITDEELTAGTYTRPLLANAEYPTNIIPQRLSDKFQCNAT
jgi:hypothetical protein